MLIDEPQSGTINPNMKLIKSLVAKGGSADRFAGNSMCVCVCDVCMIRTTSIKEHPVMTVREENSV